MHRYNFLYELSILALGIQEKIGQKIADERFQQILIFAYFGPLLAIL